MLLIPQFSVQEANAHFKYLCSIVREAVFALGSAKEAAGHLDIPEQRLHHWLTAQRPWSFWRMLDVPGFERALLEAWAKRLGMVAFHPGEARVLILERKQIKAVMPLPQNERKRA